MAFWTTEEFEKRAGTLPINPFDPTRLKHGAYELALGNEAHETSNKKEDRPVILNDGDQISIRPGQFALLMTDEEVNVPEDAIGFISIKADWKFRGLINVSGFHVDNGYKGKLKFSVFNAGAQKVIIKRGDLVFLIWFSTLIGPTSDTYQKRKNGHSHITSEDIMKIQGTIVSLPALHEQVNELVNQRRIILPIVGALVALNTAFLAIGIFVLSTTWSTMLSSRSGQRCENPQNINRNGELPIPALTNPKKDLNNSVKHESTKTTVK